MEIIPVIYLRGGKCVSFYKGDREHKTMYSQSPLSYARQFAKDGAKYIQVVDKDGGENWHIVEEMIAKVPVKIQIAAKVRNIEMVDKCFENGIGRVIIGVSGKATLKEAIEKYGPYKIFAGIKGKDRKIITSAGLPEGMEVTDYAETLRELGVKNVLYHDVFSEGSMIHPNYDEAERLVNFTNLNIYISGGISDEKHIKLLADTGVKGILIGKALYEKTLNLREII
ncbi:MAG: HisA/HisF-related TIM barrel protein [Patescibacteria group bacterium]|nr:hypothetical protein [Patescibacteria group bacterium]